MEQDARFRGLRSQLPEAYVEFAGWSVESGHAFLYLPPGLDRTKPNAALVFLHGSGGNFKAYLWLLARLADRLNLVVVAPTCGNGNWRPSDTSRVVAAAFATARRGVVIDPTNIHLLGLSNGGLGVTQLAEVPGAGYRSIIYLSPVFGERHSASAGARRPWRGRPVLVLSGRDDDRVPVRYVQEQAAALVQAEAAVTVELVDETDHFLFFSRSAQVIERLAGWLQQNGVAASPVHEPPK